MENVTPKEQAIQKFVGDNLNEKQKEGQVLIIREENGATPLPLIKPNKVHLSGTIDAPSRFYAKRKALHSADKCHVLVDRTAGTIILVVDEQYANDNYNIMGKIIPNPDLVAFGINQQKMFGIKELMQLLKFNRIHFSDKEVNAKIVTSLMNFKATVEQTIENSSDQRGNDTKQLIQKLETGLAVDFVLSMPMHKAGAPKTFKVEILCRITDGSVDVWLESRDLKELELNSVNDIIDTELKNFTEIVCIEQ